MEISSMGGCCPEPVDPEGVERRLGLLALFCLAAILILILSSWLSSMSRSYQHHLRRERLLGAEEHQSEPMPPGHLDRG